MILFKSISFIDKMPKCPDFSLDAKQIIFNVIKFVEREKGSYLIPLYNLNDRVTSVLSMSMSSVERVTREMREQEREMLEKQNELIQLQNKLDQGK